MGVIKPIKIEELDSNYRLSDSQSFQFEDHKVEFKHSFGQMSELNAENLSLRHELDILKEKLFLREIPSRCNHTW